MGMKWNGAFESILQPFGSGSGQLKSLSERMCTLNTLSRVYVANSELTPSPPSLNDLSPGTIIQLHLQESRQLNEINLKFDFIDLVFSRRNGIDECNNFDLYCENINIV